MADPSGEGVITGSDGRRYKLPKDATEDQIAAFRASVGDKDQPTTPMTARFGPKGVKPITPFRRQELTSALPVAGGMIGSLAGPEGTLAGAAAGSAVQHAADRAFGDENEKYGGTKGALRTIGEVSGEGLKQMALDIGGRVIMAPLSKGVGWLAKEYGERFARPAQQALRKGAEEAGAKLTSLEKVGPHISRTEIAANNAKTALDGALEKLSPGGSQGVEGAGRQVIDAIDTAHQEFNKVFDTEYQAFGDSLKRIKGPDGKLASEVRPEEINKNFLQSKPKLEKAVERAAPRSLGPTKVEQQMSADLKALSRGKTKYTLNGQEIPEDQVKAIMSDPKYKGSELQSNIKQETLPPKPLDFKTAQGMRSGWMKTAIESGDPGEVAAAKRAWKAVDGAMETAAAKAGPDAVKQWRAINEAYDHGQKLFNASFFENTMKRDPEALLKGIGANQPTKIRLIQDSLKDYGGKQGQEAWKTFQRSYAEKLIASNPENLSAALKASGETAKEVFSDDAGRAMYKRMEAMADYVEGVKKADKSGGKASLRVREGLKLGAVGLLSVGAGAADRAGAWAFTKIAESGPAWKALMKGLTMNPTAGKVVSNVERALALAVKGGRIVSPDQEYLSPLDKTLSLGSSPSTPER